jgi:FtsP/CotA-like multicopper oxidase with cupredoxin domain
MAPDGVEQSMIVINGQFPGPLIEANLGDWIQVTVKNEISGPEEVTALHWHGLNQPGTPWFDGLPGVGQCPIAPGASMVYKFRADEAGTSWWHSHQLAQYTQGAFGPIIVHGPSEYSDYDEDLGPVIINDWYHTYYTDIQNQVLAPTNGGAPPRPISQSNLVGGAGRFAPMNTQSNLANNGSITTAPVNARSAAIPYKSWKVEAGKRYRMRLINAGSVGFETVSIDEHKLTVIANDFIAVQPYEVDFVRLAVGQRQDVVFTASGTAGQNYWLRAFNEPNCGQTEGPDGRAIISYGGDENAEPTTTATAIPPNTSCSTDDLSLTIPVEVKPMKEPDTTITLNFEQRPDEQGVFRWFTNGVAFKGDPGQPLLSTAISQDTTLFPPERNVYNLGSNSTVRIIMQNSNLAPHPMHLHGHDFQILAEGIGTWDGHIVRPENPQRRDTVMMWGGPQAIPSYTVIQYEQDNPGIWPIRKFLPF